MKKWMRGEKRWTQEKDEGKDEGKKKKKNMKDEDER